MSRDLLDCLVEAIEYLTVDESGVECLVETNENHIVEENRRSDPRRQYIPHDVVQWFIDAARRYQSGDAKSLDRALGLVRPRGRPVDPSKLKNFDLAEKALRLRLQGKTWAETNNEVFADRAEPPDESYLRKLVARYEPFIMQKWREELRQRWLAGSEARDNRQIQKNGRKGKSRTANSG